MRIRFFSKIHRIVGFFFLLLFLSFLYILNSEIDLIALLRRLPSDEQIIDNFRNHRDDFEKLVNIYKYDLEVPFKGLCLEPTREVKITMERINVIKLCTDSAQWISTKPEIQQEKPHAFKTVHRESSGIRFIYKHGVVRRLNADLTEVKKYIYYTPLVPNVKNGELYIPHPGGPLGHTFFTQNLNKYPPIFESQDCAYRQIEPHWFIALCQQGG